MIRARGLAVLGLLALWGCDDTQIGAIAPVLNVDPDHLDFGTVELGQQSTLIITLKSLESVPVTVGGITVADDCDGCFLILNPPKQVAPFATYALEARFRAVRLPIATATVTISTDDMKSPMAKVTMVGRGTDTRKPDIAVSPPCLDFGFVPAGGVAVSSFVVRSTGTNDLLIDRMEIVPAGAPFRVTTGTPTPERPGRLAPGSQASVGLKASVPESSTGTVTGTLRLHTNVPRVLNVADEVGALDVCLKAVANLPPTCVLGPDQTVEPWSRANVDASMSRDQDNPPDEPLQYQWRMINKPAGSTTMLERAGLTSARPSFWVDLAGRYEIELVVRDALGLESEPCVQVVEALPTNAVRIELIWDHPDSDLDLHLIRENGRFCDCASDVHYRDCGRRPNWFPMSTGANPRLDVDDRTGFGPENINIDGEGSMRFIPAGRYTIAVHYYSTNEGISSWPTTTSNATVRVYVFGLLAAELSHAMTQEGQLWFAGDLVWPDKTVVPDGRVLMNQACGVF